MARGWSCRATSRFQELCGAASRYDGVDGDGGLAARSPSSRSRGRTPLGRPGRAELSGSGNALQENLAHARNPPQGKRIAPCSPRGQLQLLLRELRSPPRAYPGLCGSG
ncbi:unnamed protein product [Lampetra planeri]